MHAYWYWTSHGEVEPNVRVNIRHSSSSMDIEHDDYNEVDRLQNMVDDIMGVRQENEYDLQIQLPRGFMTNLMQLNDPCGLDVIITPSCLLVLK